MSKSHALLTVIVLSTGLVCTENSRADCCCRSHIALDCQSIQFEWRSEPYELCITLTLQVWDTHFHQPTYCPQGYPPDPEYQLNVYDCDDYLVFCTDRESVPESGDYTHCVPVCPNVPATFEVLLWNKVVSNQGQGCTTVTDEDAEGCQGAIPEPTYDLCTADLEALDCLFSGGTDELATDSLHFYKKKSDTLYMLPKDDISGAAYGEAVNGRFKAPADGGLFVTVSKSPSDLAVDVWGSEEASGPGWQTASAREGSMIDPDRCLQMAGDDLFRFNVRTGKSCGQGTLSITLDWYQWNLDTCCYEHYQGVLKRDVRFLQHELVPADPLRPQRHVHKPTDHGEVIELRLPGCCGCLDEHKEQVGNFSHWFVAWPSSPGKEIPEGFAKGWQIEGKIVRSPGPDRVEYEFSR
jgi:hypothetical protein